ncbi:hypothetical protein GOBAR_DD16787 [Gossypium barbadense]|nr:hypothetical protein GOBAR_DD16787 [Gossypium barbadense]
MAKKGSSTTPSRKAKNKKEESVPEQKNSASKVAGSEIDEIFAGKKRKKPDPKGSEKPNGDEISKPKSSKKKSKKSRETNREGGFNESSSRPRKRTADGFAIYTEEELGISKSDAGILVVEVIVKPYMIIPFLVLHSSNVVIIQNSYALPIYTKVELAVEMRSFPIYSGDVIS